MAYEVVLKPSARRDVERLAKDVPQRVTAKLTALGDNPRPPCVEKLKGQAERLYRVRTGDYRIVYAIDDQVLLVLVVRVQHRRDIYRSL
jgi:mRNA interferase RelE/StbE